MDDLASIWAILRVYLNFFGVSLVTGALMLKGVDLMSSKRKIFSKRAFWGATIFLLGLLIFLRQIPYVLSTSP